MTSNLNPEEFYSLIGKITLIHGGIEHDLKGVLVEDWGISREKVEKSYGAQLRKLFLKSIKSRNIPEKYYREYSGIIDRLWKASDQRNKLIKASYSLVGEAREVFRHDTKARGEFDPEMDFKEWVFKGGRKITFEELESLRKELGNIRESNFQLSRLVHIEKQQLLTRIAYLNRDIPEYALKNPYRYLEDKRREKHNV